MINNRSNYSIGFISLGCDKNRVDLEKMISLIKNAGYKIEANEKNSDVIIINTCSFINSAREESIENILVTAKLKNKKLKKLIVSGCLNHMGYSDLEESLPEVDAFIKTQDNVKIVEVLDKLLEVDNNNCCDNVNDLRVLTTPNHYAYLKISEGCDNFCTYCKIPYIRGRYCSYSLDDIYNEALYLVNKGVNEIILVAQDVTKYGLDFNDGTNLVKLIKKITSIANLDKLRLLYCYPELITTELINEIKTNPKVCKYIDIPLQHISNNILKRMNRKGSSEYIKNLIEKLKNNIPDIAIRTTFIVGFPGETENDFNELLNFVKTYKLNNVGFFEYSKEEGTPAYLFKDHVSDVKKRERVSMLAAAQFENVKERNKNMIGKVITVVVDSVTSSKAVCRSQYECPEIDGVIYVDLKSKLKIGSTYKVLIQNYKNYDLQGEIYEEFTK